MIITVKKNKKQIYIHTYLEETAIVKLCFGSLAVSFVL